MGETIDAGLLGHFLGKLEILYIWARLALAAVTRVITGYTAGVDTTAMRPATIFGEVTVGLAAHTLREDDAVLWAVVGLLTPNTMLRDGRIGRMLGSLHLGAEFGVG